MCLCYVKFNLIFILLSLIVSLLYFPKNIIYFISLLINGKKKMLDVFLDRTISTLRQTLSSSYVWWAISVLSDHLNLEGLSRLSRSR